MIQLSPFQQRKTRLQNSMQSTIRHFRQADDHLGLDGLLNSIDDLVYLIEAQQFGGELTINLDELMPMIRNLFKFMLAKDIVGVTDTFEFALLPLVNQW